MEKYIHYGHNNFDKNLFCPIQNNPFLAKPNGGFWASSIEAEYGWKDWCEANEFRECKDANSYIFTLKDNANILRINKKSDLISLPKCKSENTMWVILDFEKLAKEYDAIEVNISNDYSNLYFDLYGWDCDSILIMNPDIIEIIKGD